MSSNTFLFLYVFTFFIMMIFALGPIIFVFVVVRYLRRKRKEESDYYSALAKEREMIRNKQIQDEIDLKKRKYKRIKCKYCGTNNEMDLKNCVNCGDVLHNETI